MRVKCIGNRGICLPPALLTKEAGFKETTEFDLVISKNYVVYAMTIYRGYMWYYICTDDDGNYSYWKPSPLFEVFDGRMSKYWVYAYEKESPYEATWAYPEWANDPYYYHFLTDWEKDYVAHFKQYKKLMDEEFPDPSVEEKAEIGDETWLICPLCIDAWESNSPDAMVACPKCKKVFHNPRYIQNNPPGGSFNLSNQET